MAARGLVLSMSETTGHFADTIRVLVARDFRMRYKGSFFGVTWAVITPIATMALFHFVFTRVWVIGTPHFALFLYSAILPFTWLQTSVLTGCSILAENRDLVRTPFFDKALLPWTVTCTNFLFYLCALPVMFVMMYIEQLPFRAALLALPVVWVVQLVLTVGFTTLMAAIGILVRDWPHVMNVIMLFWFYLSPVFYDVSQLPDNVARFFALNPMTPVIEAHRAVVLHGEMPDWRSLGLLALASLAIFALSVIVFRSLEDSFVDQV